MEMEMIWRIVGIVGLFVIAAIFEAGPRVVQNFRPGSGSTGVGGGGVVGAAPDTELVVGGKPWISGS